MGSPQGHAKILGVLTFNSTQRIAGLYLRSYPSAPMWPPKLVAPNYRPPYLGLRAFPGTD